MDTEVVLDAHKRPAPAKLEMRTQGPCPKCGALEATKHNLVHAWSELLQIWILRWIGLSCGRCNFSQFIVPPEKFYWQYEMFVIQRSPTYRAQKQAQEEFRKWEAFQRAQDEFRRYSGPGRRSYRSYVYDSGEDDPIHGFNPERFDFDDPFPPPRKKKGRYK